MLAGKSGAADVLDVLANLHRIAVMAPDKLRAPALIAHLTAVGLAILENLDLAHLAISSQSDRIVDQIVLADDCINKEVAVLGLPGAQRRPGRP